MERLADTGGFVASCMLTSTALKPEHSEDEPGVAAAGTDVNSSGPPPSHHDSTTTGDATLPASLRPGAPGWSSALLVRALHSKVRRSILSRRDATTGRLAWDVIKWGVPINQEDMAATLLGLSVNVLNGIEFLTGRAVSEEEQADNLALWRYIGWLLGVDTVEQMSEEDDWTRRILSSNPTHDPAAGTEPLPPLDPCGIRPDFDYAEEEARLNDPINHANAAMESMLWHLLRPDEDSREMALHLLAVGWVRTKSQESWGADAARPKAASKVNLSGEGSDLAKAVPLKRRLTFAFRYRSHLCRRFLGGPLSDTLGVPFVPFLPSLPATASLSALLGFASCRERLENLLIHCLAYVHLMLLRLYTLTHIDGNVCAIYQEDMKEAR